MAKKILDLDILNKIGKSAEMQENQVNNTIKDQKHKNIVMKINENFFDKINTFLQNNYFQSKSDFLIYALENDIIDNFDLLNKIIKKCILSNTNIENFLCNYCKLKNKNKNKDTNYQSYFLPGNKNMRAYSSNDLKEKLENQSKLFQIKLKDLITIKILFFIEINIFFNDYKKEIIKNYGINSIFEFKDFLKDF
ncbi:hypothetical protein FTT16_08825 [Campylobacter jejuni]|nr:hypothetical protein [Campylobacter jejuni]